MNTQRVIIVLIIASILALPLIINSPWTSFDYLVAAMILIPTGLAIDRLTRITTTTKRKMLLGGSVILLAVYIWAELAVGIFTTLDS